MYPRYKNFGPLPPKNGENPQKWAPLNFWWFFIMSISQNQRTFIQKVIENFLKGFRRLVRTPTFWGRSPHKWGPRAPNVQYGNDNILFSNDCIFKTTKRRNFFLKSFERKLSVLFKKSNKGPQIWGRSPQNGVQKWIFSKNRPSSSPNCRRNFKLDLF